MTKAVKGAASNKETKEIWSKRGKLMKMILRMAVTELCFLFFGCKVYCQAKCPAIWHPRQWGRGGGARATLILEIAMITLQQAKARRRHLKPLQED